MNPLQQCHLEIRYSGPIGLSIMEVIRECFLKRLEERSIAIALNLSIVPKTFKRYFDDSHSRFQRKDQSRKLLDIINSQDMANLVYR